MTVRRVSRDQVLAFRLAGHGLAERRPPGDLVDVAAPCGIRNTPPGSAVLALHARVASLDTADLDHALVQSRTLVEVLGMRSSPHVVPTRDLAVFTLGALPADEASLRGALQNHLPALDAAGISVADALEQAAGVAYATLDGVMLTRGELSAAMTRQLPDGLATWCRACKSRHVQEMLFRLVGVRGVFVITRAGGDNRYVRTDHWLGEQPAGDPPTARADLLRRYLRCFGPSTPEAFAAWVGIAPGEARHAWDRVADRLVQVDVEGQRAWVHADDLPCLESPPRSSGVRLLPPYDAYLDQRDRATLLPDRALHRRVWRILGNPGIVLSDGEVVGIWRPRKQGTRLAIAVEPFVPLPPPVREGIEAETAPVARLRGCSSAEVTFAD